MNIILPIDFSVAAASGDIHGLTTYRRFGVNRDVDTAAPEDVWSSGGTMIYLSTAEQMNCVSTSANDTAAGTGARTIIVEGLDNNYAEIRETVSLNGTNNVLTSNAYLRIERAYVATAGTGGGNAGVISLTSAGSAAIQGTMAIGANQTQRSQYTVPAGKTSYIRKFVCSIGKATVLTDINAEVELQQRPFGGVWRPIETYELATAGMGAMSHELIAPAILTEKTDVRVRCTAYVNNTVCSASYEMFVVTN